MQEGKRVQEGGESKVHLPISNNGNDDDIHLGIDCPPTDASKDTNTSTNGPATVTPA